MEISLPIPPINPPATADARWYRLALLLTGNAAGAGEILRAIFSIAPVELAQLRGKERRKTWLIRQIRSRALKWQQANPTATQAADPSFFPGQISALPEPVRSVFAFFHCLDGDWEDCAHVLKMDKAVFVKTLAQAREILAPGTAFPTNPLLQVHRPWGEDSSKVAKAVQSAQENPEFAAQIAADIRWQEEIEKVTIPEELAQMHWAEPPKQGFRALFQPAVLAIALALLVVVGVVIYIARAQMDDFPGKETVMALAEDASVLNGSEFESISPTNAEKLDDWFVMKGFEGFTVPPELQKAKAVGCRVTKRDGILVAQVALDKQNALLLVFHAADAKLTGETGWHPSFQQDEWAVKAHTDKDNVCVLIFRGDSDDMPEFLKTVGK